MCGIAGIVGPGSVSQDGAALRGMMAAMQHRGPDAEGIHEGPGIALAHLRLSILDVSARGNQPMQDHTGRYTLIHNGEIYNFKEIRAQLDYPFQSETDTEMVLAAFAKWGPACLEKFNGMFAFALWDSLEQRLFIARDRLGIKPLYYHFGKGRLAFSSEIRALTALPWFNPRIKAANLPGYFTYQTVYGTETLLEDVFMLGAGEFGIWEAGQWKKEKYWDVTVAADTGAADLSATEVKTKVRDLMQKAVERRMISDVPLGAFLSGGIDSSAIVALMSEASSRPVDTFSVIFQEKEFDESPWSQMVADKYRTRHHPILLNPSDFLDALPAALKSMDHPSGDGINSYVVAEVTRAQGITVALSGLGGDELFAGYPIFTQLPAIQQRKLLWALPHSMRLLLRKLYGLLKKGRSAEKIKALLGLAQPDMLSIYQVFRTIYGKDAASALARQTAGNAGFTKALPQQSKLEALPLLSQISAAEVSTYTQSVLLRDTDQMSMAHGLEVRVPFFDHELVEFVLGVSDEVKRPAYPKKLLVESLGNLLPPEVVHRKKMGFVFPWEHWLRHDLHDFCALRIEKLQDSGLVNAADLGRTWREFQAGQGPWLWTHIWLPVVLQTWMDNNGIEA